MYTLYCGGVQWYPLNYHLTRGLQLFQSGDLV
jgi:hypothetical protein